MPKQPVFPGLKHAMKKKQTRRERFLAEMNVVVPWGRLLGLIAPHYPKTGSKGGRPLATMLRVCFLQNRYARSDPMAEETLYDSEAMRRFAGIEPGDDRIPDGPKGPWPRCGRASPKDAILNFRHLLQRHGLTQAIFADVNAHLADKGITLRSGTLVDATIIDAPSSTRNKEKACDPGMWSTRKGNAWYFGSEADRKSIRGIDFPTNAHAGVDSHTGLVHSLQTTTARVHDSQVRDELLHGDETSVWAELPLERRRQRCSDRWRSRWQLRATMATDT